MGRGTIVHPPAVSAHMSVSTDHQCSCYGLRVSSFVRFHLQSLLMVSRWFLFIIELKELFIHSDDKSLPGVFIAKIMSGFSFS